MTLGETEPDLPAGVGGGSLQRRGVALFHCGDKDSGSGGSGKFSLA